MKQVSGEESIMNPMDIINKYRYRLILTREELTEYYNALIRWAISTNANEARVKMNRLNENIDVICHCQHRESKHIKYYGNRYLCESCFCSVEAREK